MVYLLFVVWFFFLIKGADLFTDWAASIAKRFKVSDLVIGLTLVAFGTSLPELVVNLFSSSQWSSWLAIGNILGSNIANILLILWLAACIYPLALKKTTVYREIPFNIAAVLILAVFINNVFGWKDWIQMISRFEGVILLVLFVMFLVYIFWVNKHTKEKVTNEISILSVKKSRIYIVLWLVWLTFWWEWIVNGAITLAKYMWLSETTIWLTIVAIWTSLPELATSVIAARKGKSDIAIGNIVGSNIFNILRILGITATINPLIVPLGTNRDVRFLMFATIILLMFAIVRKKFTLHRYQWFIMVIAYIVYVVVLLLDSK